MSNQLVAEKDIRFVLTKDPCRLGIGYCPDKDEGGFKIIKYVPDDMLREAFAELLLRDVQK